MALPNSLTQDNRRSSVMPSANTPSSGANRRPVLTIRTCSGETETISKTDGNIPQKLRQGAKGVDLPRINVLGITQRNAFVILCGAVTVDVQLHAILGSINRTTGEMTLPKGKEMFCSYESLDYVAWTAVVTQTGYYANPNWCFTDYSLALTVRPGRVAEPFTVQHKINGDGQLEIIFWFAMQASANDPDRGCPRNNPHPIRPAKPHVLGGDFEETWCYGFEEAVMKFNDNDKLVVKHCLDLAYGGSDRWRTIERKLNKRLGFGLDDVQQRTEEALSSP